jgi:hypothetical protein
MQGYIYVCLCTVPLTQARKHALTLQSSWVPRDACQWLTAGVRRRLLCGAERVLSSAGAGPSSARRCIVSTAASGPGRSRAARGRPARPIGRSNPSPPCDCGGGAGACASRPAARGKETSRCAGCLACMAERGPWSWREHQAGVHAQACVCVTLRAIVCECMRRWRACVYV